MVVAVWLVVVGGCRKRLEFGCLIYLNPKVRRCMSRCGYPIVLFKALIVLDRSLIVLQGTKRVPLLEQKAFKQKETR